MMTMENLRQPATEAGLILREFKGYDCSRCNNHFGYQYRADPNIRFCSDQCLSEGMKIIDQIKTSSVLEGVFAADRSPCCTPGNLPHKHFYTSNPLAQQSEKSFVPVLQQHYDDDTSPGKISSHQAEKENYGTGQTNSYGDGYGDRNHVMGLIRGGGGSNRGGRGGGNSSRYGSLPRNSSRNPADNPFYNFKGEDSVDKSGHVNKGATNLTEQEFNSAFEKNTSKPTDFVTIEQQQENRSAFIAAARKPAIVPEPKVSPPKPIVPQQPKQSNTMPIMKVISKPKPDDTPAPVKIEVPTVLPVKKEEEVKKKTPVPILVGLKRPGGSEVKSPSPSVQQQISPKKKVWTISDLPMSLSLVNGAPCNIPFMWNMSKFHINANQDGEKLDNLQAAIAAYCLKAPAVARVPAVDDIIIAPYLEEFFRAKVTVVNPADDTLKVMFIDYGDEATVKRSECHEPTDEIMNDPCYGVVFTLTLEKDLPETLLKGPVPVEIESVKEAEVYMTIEKKLDGHFTGRLHLDDSKTFNDMVNDLIKKASSPAIVPKLVPVIASPVSVPKLVPVNIPTAKPVQVETKPVQKEDVKQTQEEVKPVSPQRPHKAPFQVTVNLSKSASPPPPKWTIRNVKFSDSLVTGALVTITYGWSISKLNLSASKDSEKLDAVQGEIEQFVAKAPEMTRAPQLDEIVLAPFDDGVYYRGRVAETKGNCITIVFIDYGGQRTVQLSQIKEPSDEIMKHPIYGACLQMSDVPDNNTEITDPTLKALLESESQLEIESKDDPKLWTGLLWVAQDKSWNDLAIDFVTKGN